MALSAALAVMTSVAPVALLAQSEAAAAQEKPKPAAEAEAPRFVKALDDALRAIEP